MPSLSRRSFLQRSLLGSSGLALSTLLPASLACRARETRRTGPLSSVGHVVIFMQENRSFDHYFGTLSGVRGFGDPHALRLATGSTVFGQQDAFGTTIYPFRLDAATTRGQCVADLPHDAYTGTWSLDSGRMDQWVAAKGTNTVGYHTRADIPFHYALADAFTLCDHYFCSVNTSTNPNRLFLFSGTVDADGLYEGPILNNSEAVPFTWTTYPERLEAAGVSWQVYQENDNYDDNALAWFKTFQEAPTDSSLYLRGMARGTRSSFVEAVQADALPAVSFIIAPAALSEHPAYAPNAGADLCKTYLDALAQNPKVWEKTVFIYTMDENGGFFDHVVPPTAPYGTPGEYANGEPIGYGVRVPTIVVSPFSTGGFVCSEVFDHTSILRFLEHFTGVVEPNISAYRRKVSGDLISAFDFRASSAAFPGTLPDTAPLVAAAATACGTLADAAPSGETSAPAQEAGKRPLRALPYQLAADLTVDTATLSVRVSVRNTGSRAVPVDLHGLSGVDELPRLLTVDAGGSAVESFEVAASTLFDVELHGPNGFFRRFAGSAEASASGAPPEVSAVLDAATDTLRLSVRNPGTDARTLTIADDVGDASTEQALAAGESRVVSIPLVDRWYDVRIGLLGEDEAHFLRAYAGHLEGSVGVTR